MLQTTVENYSGCFCIFIEALVVSIPTFCDFGNYSSWLLLFL